jgi:hypothetical protein
MIVAKRDIIRTLTSVVIAGSVIVIVVIVVATAI